MWINVIINQKNGLDLSLLLVLHPYSQFSFVQELDLLSNKYLLDKKYLSLIVEFIENKYIWRSLSKLNQI